MTSTSYPADLSDWRGLFIRHLAFALARRPEVEIAVWAPPGELPENVRNVATPSEREWLQALMVHGGIASIMRRGGWRGLLAPARLLAHLHRAYRRQTSTSIYHVNWLQNALVLPHDRKPALVTVLGEDLRLLALPGMRAALRRIFRRRATIVCPNAAWMAPILRDAFGDVANVAVMPFGIDPEWYEVKRTSPRRGDETWLCVTRLTPAKIGPLFDWGRTAFDGANRRLHLFGPMQEAVQIPDWVDWHGPVTPTELRNEWFPSATGLVTLSRHAEGRPQVMLEAMAAGLPIVASDLPAHRDLVRPGETGWLCADAAAFEEALALLAEPETNATFGHHARDMVAREMGTWDDCASRYISGYLGLLDGRRHD